MFTIIGADGKEYGPVATAAIVEWIAAGRANLQTKARREGEAEWKTLGDFAEFNAPPVLGANNQPAAPGIPAAPVPLTPAPLAPAAGPESALRWLRLGAAILDGIIGAIFVTPGMLILASAGVFANANHPNTAVMFGGIAAIGAAFLLLLAVQIYLLVTRGQTIGKKLLGVKIVCFEDESNPGFVKVFLLRILVNGFIGAVPFLGMAYSLVDILFIFRGDQRCIHDLLAGTKVVRA